MIDRYLLRYFLAIVDHGNFSRAAAQCNVSQPTLSVGIAKLEREVGVALFLRSSQRVNLTEAGVRFLAHARRIELEFNAALHAMAERSAVPVLRVGVMHSIPGARVANAVRAALAEQPASPVEVVYATERELIARLARGRIDVALTVVERGSDRFLEQALLREDYALAVADSHPLAPREEIAAEELRDDVMIVRRHCEVLADTSRFFTERGVRPRFALRSTNEERVLQMVAAGLGITVMPASYGWPGVSRPRLAGFGLSRRVGFLFGHESEHLRDQPHGFLAALAAEFIGASPDWPGAGGPPPPLPDGG
ncbi:MAG: LysR family transcriptional regulator [Novosphingobium sp.]